MQVFDDMTRTVPAPTPPAPLVWSCNEWDTLEEVIVGTAVGACWPADHGAVRASMPVRHQTLLRESGGRPMPAGLLAAAERELDALAHLLEKEGVVVRRPDRHPHHAAFSTPEWSSASGLYAAMPRDVALVVGDMIIEAPMAWRCRHFEIHAYRSLILDYFERGARWIAAPKPRLADNLYYGEGGEFPAGTVSEVEPVFDAADFLRLGTELIGQVSNVTNRLGIEWLRRHLPNGFTISLIKPVDDRPMHIDATLLPLARGKLMINPDRLPKTPQIFRDWDVRPAPRPAGGSGPPLYMSSAWISMNLLSLDEKRVLVESQQFDLIAFLRDWGFQPIPHSFRHFQALGGSFHCATLDIRRRTPATHRQY